MDAMNGKPPSPGRHRPWLWGLLAAGTLALALGGAATAETKVGFDTAAASGNDKAGGMRDDFGSAGNATPAASTTKPVAMTEDARVVADLHRMNRMEISAGRMADEKGKASAVRVFGRRLARDHRAADAKVMAYSAKTGIDASAASPEGMEQAAKDQRQMERLRSLSGADFDRLFATTMERDHERAIDAVQNARGNVTDPNLRALLGQLLPTLQRHRAMAQALLVKVSAAPSASPATAAQGRRPSPER
jgi:putative membrane protein